MRIALLFETSTDRAAPFAAGLERYQRFIGELGRYSREPVDVVKDSLQNVPSGDYVLFVGANVSRSLAACGPELAKQLAPRIVLLDVSWQTALDQLEKHRLAGAVDSLRLSEWLARPSSCTGPFGLRTLTRTLRASCVPLPWLSSAHYCLMQSKSHNGLPHLLAEYLAAYDRDQKPLSAETTILLSRTVTSLEHESESTSHTSEKLRTGSFHLPQMESVTIKRAIESLKRARSSVRRTLATVAESAGIPQEELDLLESSDYPNAKFGALRAYILALADASGWTIAQRGETAFSPQEASQELVSHFGATPSVSDWNGMTVTDSPTRRRNTHRCEFDVPFAPETFHVEV